MGIGMVAVCSASESGAVLQHLTSGFEIGRIIEGNGEVLIV